MQNVYPATVKHQDSGGEMSRTQVAAVFGRHLLALTFPLNALFFVLTGPHPAPVAPLFLVPILGSMYLDYIAGAELQAPSPRLPELPFNLLLAALAALQLINVTFLARMCAGQSFWSVDAIIGGIVVGSSSGYSGVVVAHELIHRRNRWSRFVGRLLMSSVLYEHFCTEHIRGHHARVGTKADPATARFGETFLTFYLRTVPGQFKSAFLLEATRLGSPPVWHPKFLRNRVVQGVLFEWSAAALFGVMFGLAAFLTHLLQSLWATRALEVVNYFEHWGLEREGRRVLPKHSWDTTSWFTHYALTGLSRHADHHSYASRPFQQLRLWDESPKLPRGYLAMFPLVLLNNKKCIALLTQELQRCQLGPFHTGKATGPVDPSTRQSPLTSLSPT